MLFAFPITVPANTTIGFPVVQTLKLDIGVITNISIKFPAGCHGLVNVKLLRNETVLVPLNQDTFLNGDDETIESDVYYEFDSPPYELKFIGISTGTTYNHTILIRVNILSPDVALPNTTMQALLSLLQQYLRVPTTVSLP